jgi:hypothetical protein
MRPIDYRVMDGTEVDRHVRDGAIRPGDRVHVAAHHAQSRRRGSGRVPDIGRLRLNLHNLDEMADRCSDFGRAAANDPVESVPVQPRSRTWTGR